MKETHNRARTGIALRADWDTVRRAEVQQKLAAIAPGYADQALTPLASLGVLELADGDRVLSQEVTALLIALRISNTRAAAPVALVGTQARSQPAASKTRSSRAPVGQEARTGAQRDGARRRVRHHRSAAQQPR